MKKQTVASGLSCVAWHLRHSKKMDKNGRNGMGAAAFKVLMSNKGCLPMDIDDAEYAALIRRCRNTKALSDGRRIHTSIAACGRDRSPYLGNLLLQMYVKCGSVQDARKVFDNLGHRDVYSFNFMISVHAQNGHASESLELYRWMQKEGITANKFTFFPILSASASLHSLEDGKHIHEHIIACGFQGDVALCTALVNMYGKCGSLEHAWHVFDHMQERDAISFNAMISACAQNGRSDEGLELFRNMSSYGIRSNRISFLSTLDACARLASLENGRAIHKCILASGLHQDIAINNALVNMYGKCGSLQDAQTIFDQMHEKDLISWNSMISAFVYNGNGNKALQLFTQMKMEGLKPDRITYLSTLDACSDSASLKFGRTIHEEIIGCGLELDVALETALIIMYGKCGSIKDALLVFNQMYERDVISWTSMIAAFIHNHHGNEALKLFKQMDLTGVKPSRITFLTILDACSSSACLETGRTIHKYMIASGFQLDIAIRNALVNMYGKCSCLKDAQNVFNDMYERDVISWNCMIAAYIQNGYKKEGLELFRKMMRLEGIKPNKVTFLNTLDGCASLPSLENGRVVHAVIVASQFESDLAVRTALVNMYGKCGSMKDSLAVFNKMHEPDVSLWNAMMSAYVQNGHGTKALELFSKLDLKGIKPDRITFLSALDACSSLALLEYGKVIHQNIVDAGFDQDITVKTALINMYGKCGSWKSAHDIFCMMHERDLFTWNAMIVAYVQNRCSKKGLELYRLMELEGIKPDCISYLNTLVACTELASLENGRLIHEQIVASGLDINISLRNALVTMYGKCGSLRNACTIFDAIHDRNLISWNAMISVYEQNGCDKEALELFRLMDLEDVQPDSVTFFTILSACSHGGFLGAGQQYFISMSQDYGLQPSEKHFVCMTDLLGRAGFLEEAEDLINNITLQPSPTAWISLLAACRIHGNVERGICAAHIAYESEQLHNSPHCLLSNIYAAASKWKGVAEMRKQASEGAR